MTRRPSGPAPLAPPAQRKASPSEAGPEEAPPSSSPVRTPPQSSTRLRPHGPRPQRSPNSSRVYRPATSPSPHARRPTPGRSVLAHRGAASPSGLLSHRPRRRCPRSLDEPGHARRRHSESVISVRRAGTAAFLAEPVLGRSSDSCCARPPRDEADGRTSARVHRFAHTMCTRASVHAVMGPPHRSSWTLSSQRRITATTAICRGCDRRGTGGSRLGAALRRVARRGWP
jgi:hypothetical protein